MTIPFASQHSPSFPALLRELGASVVVSTYQAGALILLRAEGALLNTHFCTLEKPMGLTAQTARLAVGTGYQLWEYHNLPAVASKLTTPEPHDACYLPRSVHVTGDIDIHEMAYAADGELWFVNTRMSCLCTLEAAYSVVPRWRPRFVTAYDLTDRCHLNGLALKDDHPAFVTALGETDTPAGWRANKASGGVLMDVASGRVIARGLSMPHSPRWHDAKLWYLESGAGRLSVMDPMSGAQRVIAEVPGFTRGLDFVGRYAFIGLSQVRETAVFAGLPLTARVAERHCGVWVVDTVSGQTVAQVLFTGSVQEIFAVQVLPHRFPGLLDMGDPLLRSSYALPDAALADLAPADPVTAALAEATEQHRQKQLDMAIAGYRAVLARTPEHLSARFQLGVALADAERWVEGEAELIQVVARQPGHAEAHNSLGLCCAGQERWQETLVHYEQALIADRQYATAHFNRGLILLKLGRYAEGWKEYESRWQMPTFIPFACPQPKWQGEDIQDKTLLVHTEQGAGDALQFGRFLPLAAARCKKLLLVCTEALRALLATVDGVAETRLAGAIPLESFDLYCPLLSLPGVLAITLENLPAAVPYVRVPNYLSVPCLDAGEALKIGVAWAGNPTHVNDRHRSCPPENLEPLFALPEVRCYSLQTPLARETAAWLTGQGVVNLELELTDYARTAALVAQIDLVISVDTAVAHVAGALGKPVWVLLGQHTDWRWLLDREDSPWYPTARLFRQMRPGEWGELVERVGEALSAETSSRPTLMTTNEAGMR